MAVVKNLMIRIGADFSGARKGMQDASAELDRFKRKTTRSTEDITGRRGLGGLRDNFKTVGSSITTSLSELRGAKGLGGVVTGLAALRPAVGAAASSLRGLGLAAGGAAAALGPVGIAIGVVTVAIGAMVGAVAVASQTAVKFESTIGRLNMQLKGSSREFLEWARAQGLAKSASAELGATYSVLLSSFGYNNKQLLEESKKISQATRVVASATGRTIEDTLERMRSGLLGNTEAIEDLGIFVGISMIESTKAFKQFANGKSWDQLDFRIQQQIRLAAILEQAYARYGNELQKNVMTKQDALVGQLKDIKLNFSQSFLPIYDAVLPALTKLAEKVAGVTEAIARFVYGLRGWDYDALTKGSDKQSDAVADQGKAYDDLGKSAKKARGELAAFDQLNLLGKPDSGTGGGSGGTGGGAPGTGGGNKPGGNDPGSGINFPTIPPELTKRYKLEFDPPTPPDAGAGSVAIAVTNTINGLIAETKRKFGDMWDGLKGRTLLGVGEQLTAWDTLSWSLSGVTVPAMTAAIVLNWGEMWDQLKVNTTTNAPILQLEWSNMLSGMLANLVNYRIGTIGEWDKIKLALPTITGPLAEVKVSWHDALDYMQSQLNAYEPYISWGVYLISQSLTGLQINTTTTAGTWEFSWASMMESLQLRAQPMISLIDSITSAWGRMTASLMQPITMPNIQLPKIELPNIAPAFDAVKEALTPDTVSDKAGRNIPVLGQLLRGLDSVGSGVEDSGIGAFLRSLAVPGASLGGLGNAVSGAAAKGGSMLEKLRELIQGGLSGIPAFATGAVVYGPTLAMVGDNKGAATNPEVIAPLSDLENIMGNGGRGDNRELVNALQRVEQAVKDLKYVQAVISQREAGGAAIREIQDHIRRTGQAPFTV